MDYLVSRRLSEINMVPLHCGNFCVICPYRVDTEKEDAVMAELFQFEWPVDQNGYATEHRRRRDADGYGEGEFEYIFARGGPPRFYRPLDGGSLWVRFADACRSREGVLQFVDEYGMLRHQDDSVDHYRRLADRLWAIYERLSTGDRTSATAIFTQRDLGWSSPMMHETIQRSLERPEAFELAVFPNLLEDALKHQAAEAITGNRQFRRCRNQECENWFRLGPRAATEGRRQTFTARREFCSDRCRVAHARHQRREPTAPA